jgi:hypothetical protein
MIFMQLQFAVKQNFMFKKNRRKIEIVIYMQIYNYTIYLSYSYVYLIFLINQYMRLNLYV